MPEDGLVMNVDTRKLAEIIGLLPGKAEDLLAAIATEMVSDIKQGMIDSPATGITYTRGSVQHTASEAGNAPRPDIGELLGSITHQATGTLEQTIHDQVAYGKWLEIGTEFMAARPFMKPVFEQWRTSRFGQFVDDYPLVT